MNFAGKIAVITGGAQGIGRWIQILFRKQPLKLGRMDLPAT